MENASKALLIAGAILIAILLIGIGMMIFGNIGGFTESATQQTDTMQIQMFNRQFEQYAGSNVSGSNVKVLISNINANNATYLDDPSRQIVVDTATANQVVTCTPATATKGTACTLSSASIGVNYRYTVKFGTDASGFINKVSIVKK